MARMTRLPELALRNRSREAAKQSSWSEKRQRCWRRFAQTGRHGQSFPLFEENGRTHFESCLCLALTLERKRKPDLTSNKLRLLSVPEKLLPTQTPPRLGECGPASASQRPAPGGKQAVPRAASPPTRVLPNSKARE